MRRRDSLAVALSRDLPSVPLTPKDHLPVVLKHDPQLISYGPELPENEHLGKWRVAEGLLVAVIMTLGAYGGHELIEKYYGEDFVAKYLSFYTDPNFVHQFFGLPGAFIGATVLGEVYATGRTIFQERKLAKKLEAARLPYEAADEKDVQQQNDKELSLDDEKGSALLGNVSVRVVSDQKGDEKVSQVFIQKYSLCREVMLVLFLKGIPNVFKYITMGLAPALYRFVTVLKDPPLGLEGDEKKVAVAWTNCRMFFSFPLAFSIFELLRDYYNMQPIFKVFAKANLENEIRGNAQKYQSKKHPVVVQHRPNINFFEGSLIAIGAFIMSYFGVQWMQDLWGRDFVGTHVTSEDPNTLLELFGLWGGLIGASVGTEAGLLIHTIVTNVKTNAQLKAIRSEQSSYGAVSGDSLSHSKVLIEPSRFCWETLRALFEGIINIPKYVALGLGPIMFRYFKLFQEKPGESLDYVWEKTLGMYIAAGVLFVIYMRDDFHRMQANFSVFSGSVEMTEVEEGEQGSFVQIEQMERGPRHNFG